MLTGKTDDKCQPKTAQNRSGYRHQGQPHEDPAQRTHTDPCSLREPGGQKPFDVPENLVMVGRYWLLFQLIDMLAAAAGLKLGGDRKSWRLLPLVLFQRFSYRQLLYYVAVRTLLAAVKGRLVGWGKLLRTGNAATPAAAHS